MISDVTLMDFCVEIIALVKCSMMAIDVVSFNLCPRKPNK